MSFYVHLQGKTAHFDSTPAQQRATRNVVFGGIAICSYLILFKKHRFLSSIYVMHNSSPTNTVKRQQPHGD